MNCKNVNEILYDYTRGEISAEEKSSVETHLNTCGTCSKELEKLRALHGIFLNGLREPSMEVLANIRKSMPAGRWSLFPVIFKPALAFAAAILLMAGVFLYPRLDSKVKLSNTLADDYNITETALYDDSAEFEEVSYIYGNDYDNEVF